MKEVIIEIPKRDEKGNEITSKHSVVMRRLNYGEKVDLEEEAVDVKIVNGQPLTKISMSKLRTLGILKSLVKSDLPLNSIEAIRNLPQEAGDALFEAYIGLNGMEFKKKD